MVNWISLLKRLLHAPFILMAIMFLILGACRTTLSLEDRWEIVKNSNTVTEYNDFIKWYPKSKYTNEAKDRLNVLEDKEWEEAKKSNDILLYSSFLRKFQTGQHYSEAKKRFHTLEDEKAEDDSFIIKQKYVYKKYKSYYRTFPETKYLPEIRKKTREFLREVVEYNSKKYNIRIMDKQSFNLGTFSDDLLNYCNILKMSDTRIFGEHAILPLPIRHITPLGMREVPYYVYEDFTDPIIFNCDVIDNKIIFQVKSGAGFMITTSNNNTRTNKIDNVTSIQQINLFDK